MNKPEAKMKNCEVYKELRRKYDKSQEQLAEEALLTRDKLGDYERGKATPSPEDIVNLSRNLNGKRLCRWYCYAECPVGKEIDLLPVDPMDEELLSTTMMKIMNELNKLKQIDINRLIEISMDGVIDKSELSDYNILRNSLAELGHAYGTLLRIEDDGKYIEAGDD
ncbi:MAG: helix-turn-helix domain-containing protein [Lachnospiraceae bacterium]|nr:helix-turn-helix domain-containing protein [Lachnospiraceae bacterium]